MSGNTTRRGALPRASVPRARVGPVEIDNVSQQEAVEAIDRMIAGGGSHCLYVVNASKLVEARRNDRLRRMLAGADLVTADGMSVVWAARLLGRPLKERVTGIDLFERLVGHAAGRGLSVYLLGAREEAVRGVVERFTAEHPALRVAGYRDGYFGAGESERVAEAIRESRADMLFVAMGSPRQEEWIAAHLERSGVRFAMGVGGSFDHLSGRARRAPAWMQRAGLEWLHRLLRGPRGRWRRYLVGNTMFILMVIEQLWKEGRRGRKPLPH
jgi:N-acetylglucosaminyldiphosphoundecaprenol N-acetyl-beta-D-mannosaminyltransferase